MKVDVEDFAEMKEAVRAMCALCEDADEDSLFRVMLVARELMTNALRYGGGRAHCIYSSEGDVLRLSVRGEREFCPPQTIFRVPADAEGGRGLFLVDAFSEKRGYSAREGITVEIRITHNKS